ncbi:hypothetical protein ACIQM0_10400 [Streptomyces sp. NPDC091387]|uniref:hypothetical protein n=1 Tax=Streptomyces sp. NPDC091387 TaxID=3365998 RepID=UPI0037F9DA9B
MVVNWLTAPTHLWRVDRWAGEWTVEEDFAIEPELLNDDHLGRAPDAVASHLTEITDSVGPGRSASSALMSPRSTGT